MRVLTRVLLATVGTVGAMALRTGPAHSLNSIASRARAPSATAAAPPRVARHARASVFAAALDEGDDEEAAVVVDSPFELGEPVRMRISHFSPLGVNVVVNAMADGLVFASELAYPPRLGSWTGLPVRAGDVISGYVAQVRPDGKLDISLRKFGFAKAEASRAALLLALMASADKSLPIGDASTPDQVRAELAISKAQFKVAAGALWKAGVIERPAANEVRLAKSAAAAIAGKAGGADAADAGAGPDMSKVVFVQGLPFDVGAQELVEHLRALHPTAPPGPVLDVGAPDPANWIASIRGLGGADGRPSGRAWIEFATAEAAAELLAVAPSFEPAYGGARERPSARRADAFGDDDEAAADDSFAFALEGDADADGGGDGGAAAAPAAARTVVEALGELGGRRLEWMSAESRDSRQALRVASLPTEMTSGGSGRFDRPERRERSAAGAVADGGEGGADEKPRDPPGTTVFVANLPFDTTEDEVRSLFASAGKLRRVQLPKDEMGRSRGFAHVGFESTAEAEVALTFSGRQFAGREVRIELAAERPGPRKSPFDRGSGRGKGAANFFREPREGERGSERPEYGGGGERDARPRDGYERRVSAAGGEFERRPSSSFGRDRPPGGGFERREGGFGRDRPPPREGGGFERRDGGFGRDRPPRPAGAGGDFERRPPSSSFGRDRPPREGGGFERRDGGFGRDRPPRPAGAGGDFERRPPSSSFGRDRPPSREGGGFERRGPPRGDGPPRARREGGEYTDRREQGGEGDGTPRFRVVKFATSDFDVGKD